jgi:hypothetical protein
VEPEETLRSIYRSASRAEAAEGLGEYHSAVERAGLRPFDASAKGIAQRHMELLAYFGEPTTDCYAEGVITKSRSSSDAHTGYPPSLAPESASSQPVGNRTTRRHPATSTRTQISAGARGLVLVGAHSFCKPPLRQHGVT